jgi:hypothetical protein
LKHLEGIVKRIQEALGAGCEMAVRKACLNLLRNLAEDLKVTLDRVALVGQ